MFYYIQDVIQLVEGWRRTMRHDFVKGVKYNLMS